MKTFINVIICIMFFQMSIAQTALTDYFIANGERIEIEISKTDSKYKIKLSKGENSEEFNLGSNVGDFFDFKKQFRNKVYTILLGLPTPAVNQNEKDAWERIDQEAESIYYSFANNLRVLDNLDYKPNTGTLKVNDRTPIYLNKADFIDLKSAYENEAKQKFKEKIAEIDYLIKTKPSDYENSILSISEELNIQQYETIIEITPLESDKETQIKTYTTTLLTNPEQYNALESQYISNLFNQYIPNDIDSMVFTMFIIDDIEFEFSKGFLEIIKISGHLDCDTDNSNLNCQLIPSFLKKKSKIIFTNKYGIGFTSRENYRKLENVSLRLNQVDKKFTNENFNNLTRDTEIFKTKLKKQMFLLMDDLINYDFYVNKLTRDFSPKDQKVIVEGGKKLTLTKEETRKILEMEVYSDFQGFDAESPNGLIQMELSKHFNINTKRRDAIWGFNWLVDGYGWLQYTEIAGGITKIEDKERRLNPERIDTETMLDDDSVIIDAARYTTPVDLINYSAWNIGQDINLLLIDNPDLKHQFHINGGLRFNRTAVQDSIRTVNSADLKAEEYSVSYWRFFPEVKMHLLPEERYGFYAMWRPTYVHLISDRIEFQSVADPVTGFRRRVSNWVNQFEFKGYVDVGDKGQLFLRWRLNHEMGYSANNFSQIQLGYSFYIFGRNESKASQNNND